MKSLQKWQSKVQAHLNEQHIRLILWLLTFALIALIGGAPEVSGGCVVC